MATTLVPGNNGQEKVVIDSPHGIVEVYRLGACLTRYAKAGKQTAMAGKSPAREVIFLSKTSAFLPGKAIRGGVPICWPWFGPHPTDPKAGQHGFARTALWDVIATSDNSVTLSLEASAETKAKWPHDFRLTYTVTLDAAGLTFALQTTNTCNDRFTFGEALHTYFAIGDISQTTVTGFKGLTYIDKVDGAKQKTETADRAPVTGETDRVYLNAAGPHVIHNPAGDLVVHKRGSADTVFWNPWSTKAEGLPDLAGNQWPTFVCVEAVNTGANAVTLAPGESHTIECRVEPV